MIDHSKSHSDQFFDDCCILFHYLVIAQTIIVLLDNRFKRHDNGVAVEIFEEFARPIGFCPRKPSTFADELLLLWDGNVDGQCLCYPWNVEKKMMDDELSFA